jgi:glycine cleavage system H lipoate-binding protein
MVAIFFLLTVIIFLAIDYIIKKRESALAASQPVSVKQTGYKPTSIISGPYFHPTHSWAKVTDDVVTVGIDEFTNKLIGRVQKLEIPKVGSYLQQGQTAWKLTRGRRELPQSSPVEGEVMEINSELLQNPAKINESPYKDGWILKIKPNALRQNLKNLLHGETAKNWLENARSQFVLRFADEVGPVCQDGGELIDNAGELLTDAEWNEVLKEFFMTDN